MPKKKKPILTHIDEISVVIAKTKVKGKKVMVMYFKDLDFLNLNSKDLKK